uniref:Adaptin ear-binding coat-associated protein 1 n=1 Tax=Oryzias latipes TaxID=8090 RepID=A0A3P9L4H6_ORYLA
MKCPSVLRNRSNNHVDLCFQSCPDKIKADVVPTYLHSAKLHIAAFPAWILCSSKVKPSVPYPIPGRGYWTLDWKLDSPDWSGRMRITVKGKGAFIKLEDKVSGELFAQPPVKEYPAIAVETVSDSSCYFVQRIQDDSERTCFRC